MKVLVTGGTGFVGSHILDHLIDLQSKSDASLEIYATRRYHLSRRDKVLHLQKKIHWVDYSNRRSIVNAIRDGIKEN